MDTVVVIRKCVVLVDDQEAGIDEQLQNEDHQNLLEIRFDSVNIHNNSER